MNDVSVSFPKNIYRKKPLFSSIDDWHEFIEIVSIEEIENDFIVNVKSDIEKIEVFVNYVLDKCSMEEIAS